MKKTILASAILLAGAANAAEVYNNDNTTISLGGSFRGNVVIDGSDEVNFQDAGSRFDIKAAKTLDNGLKAFGQFEVKYTGGIATFDDTETGDDRFGNTDGLYMNSAFVGLEHDVYGKVTLGKKLGLGDALVMNDFSYENGNYNFEKGSAGSGTEDQLEYTKSFGAAKVVVGLIDQDTYALGGTYDVSGLTLGVAYTMKSVDGASDNSSLIAGAQYALDALTVGVQYQTVEVSDVETSGFGIGAHYALGQASVYAMYDMVEVADVDGSEIVIGADYEIAKDVKTYVEFNSSDADDSDSDETLWVGGRVYF